MAKISKLVEAEILAELALGHSPKDIAERFPVSRASVYNMKTKYEQDLLKDNQVVMARKATTINRVVQEMKKSAPPAVQRDLDELLDTAKSLQKLESGFHARFEQVLTVADSLLSRENVSVIEWQIVTNTLASAFKDIYNSKGPTVNIQQNGGAGENSLSMFQSRMRS